MRRLEDMPEGVDGLKPLVCFVSLLSKDRSLTSDQQEALKVWTKHKGLSPEMSSIEQEQVQPDKVETCLMVKVKHRAVNDPSQGYLLSAALVIDPNPFERKVKLIETPIEKVTRSIKPNAPEDFEDKMEAVLQELFKICGAEHKVALNDLTVQLFLPKEFMSLPIEHWQLPKGKQCCGQRCKAVLVRSSERYSLDYDWSEGDWKNYWDRFLDSPEAKCADTLPILNPATGNTYIQSHEPKVLGCRFVEHHQQEKQKDFWEDVLLQGLPIAFWIRRLGMTPEEVTEKAMELEASEMENCSIAKLPESLMKKRQNLLRDLLPNRSKSEPALSQKEQLKKERLKKAPFCLLWDNPFRPFPTIDYQSE